MPRKLATLAAAMLITILTNVQAYALDLTGLWAGNDGGRYYMRQVGSVLWWYGSRTDPATQTIVWSNVAHGTISGKQIKLTWADVPQGPNRNNGILVLKIVSSGQLVATKRTGGFGGSSWNLGCGVSRPATAAAAVPPPPCG
jgi:hypothetical protein